MPLVSSHHIDWRPSYGLFSLRDITADASVGASDAISAAQRDVAAGAPYEIWVKRKQDLLLIAVDVQIWNTVPSGPPSTWTGPLAFPLPCPSGELRLSDGSETALTGMSLPSGAGTYRVEVFHAGREEAVQTFMSLIDTVDQLPVNQHLAYLDSHAAGIERYLLRVFPADSGDIR